MSQGIKAALEHLENTIMSITPKTDLNNSFVAVQRGDGFTVDLDERSFNNRRFELAVDLFPTDDGATGITGRKRTRIDLRVRYEIPTDYSYLSRMIAEDVSKLIETLKDPTYDLENTGIISVIPLQPTFEPIADINGARVAFILTIPFDLLFLES